MARSRARPSTARRTVRGDPVEQVLRSEQVRQRDQSRLRDQPGPDQQALLGQAEPAEQKLLQDAAIEAATFQRAYSREASAKAVGELKAKGMQYNDIAPAELARMRAEVKPGPRQVRRVLRPGRGDAVQERAGARLQALSWFAPRGAAPGTAGIAPPCLFHCAIRASRVDASRRSVERGKVGRQGQLVVPGIRVDPRPGDRDDALARIVAGGEDLEVDEPCERVRVPSSAMIATLARYRPLSSGVDTSANV